MSISAADPLNLAGILTPGEKVPRLPGNRLLFESGVPIAVQSGGDVRYLTPLEAAAQWDVKNLLIRKQRPGSYVEAPARRSDAVGHGYDSQPSLRCWMVSINRECWRQSVRYRRSE